MCEYKWASTTVYKSFLSQTVTFGLAFMLGNLLEAIPVHSTPENATIFVTASHLEYLATLWVWTYDSNKRHTVLIDLINEYGGSTWHAVSPRGVSLHRLRVPAAEDMSSAAHLYDPRAIAFGAVFVLAG